MVVVVDKKGVVVVVVVKVVFIVSRTAPNLLACSAVIRAWTGGIACLENRNKTPVCLLASFTVTSKPCPKLL